MVFLRVHDDWEENGGVWRNYPWPTFEVGAGRPWPEEPVWVTQEVTEFIRRWYEEGDPRRIEVWVCGDDPSEVVCYYTSEEPRRRSAVRIRTREPEPWWVMRAVW